MSGGYWAYLDLSTQMVAAGQVVNTGSVLEVLAGLLPLFMMVRIVITSSGLTEETLDNFLQRAVWSPETQCGIPAPASSVSNATRYEGVVC